MKPDRTCVTTGLIAAALSFCGCQSGDNSEARQVRHLKPQDFYVAAADSGNGDTADGNGSTVASARRQPPAPAVAAPVDTTSPPATLASWTPPVAASADHAQFTVLTTEAQVGQINGRPVYASTVFRDMGIDLTALSSRLSRLQFRDQMTQLIVANLHAKVQNALILAEIESRLEERETLGLLAHLKKIRENIISDYGKGVEAVAEERLRGTGSSVDQEVENWRQEFLIGKYKHDQVRPRVHVSRREVERYYYDNIEQFKGSATVTVRLILVFESSLADEAQRLLAEGKPFEEVARQFSRMRADSGGLMEPFKLEGSIDQFKGLGQPELNEAVRTLKPGEPSPRINTTIGGRPAYGWVKLESLEGGQGRTLAEAYLDIERTLQVYKYNRELERHIAQLWQDGNFTPIDQMTNVLVEVAMARYARPQ